MNYINIENGFPLRDRGRTGKGHLHAIIGNGPDGTIIEQSRDHGQIIQRAIHPDGKLEITYFIELDDGIKQLDEITVYLPDGAAARTLGR